MHLLAISQKPVQHKALCLTIHPGKQPFTIIEGDLNAECGLNADETEGYAWMRIELKACGNEVMKE